MQIDGPVLIARFALEKFWDTHFLGLINYVSDEITSGLCTAYQTFSDISLAHYNLSEYSYSRRINDDLCLHISLEEDDYVEDLVDCYMDEVTLPSGKVVLRRNNDSIISIYEGYAATSFIPMVARVYVLDEMDEVVTELYHSVHASELAGRRIKIHDRQELIHEAFTNLREVLGVSEDKISDAA
ncbi:hypothetical protein QPK13_22785 [Photorhabdus tasmaniensis]